MTGLRAWRPARAADGPYQARAADIAALNEVFSESSTAKHRLGTYAETRDGRGFRYVQAGASALVVGFLTGFLGVGGGFLIVPALVLALGYSMPVAVGTSLVIISITSAGAFTERLGTGATIPWEIVVPFTLAAIAGSFAGKVISDKVTATTLTRSFAALLLAVAVYVTVQASMAL